MASDRQYPTWQEQLHAAMDDPEACAAFGRAVLEIQSRLGFHHDFESLDAAAAFYRALSIAREDAMVRGDWRRQQRAAGREVSAPFPEIRLPDVAQQLCYDAWEVQGSWARVAFAKLALQLDGDCADAYFILAEETARTPVEKQALYEQAMQAGERALGPEPFKQEVGSFWGILETRPYMRARFALAECLWEQGDHRAAIGHFQALLRLNPRDNQGVRYPLASCLLEAGDDAGFAALVKRWHRILAADAPRDARNDPGIDDYESAMWLYPRSLAAFRTHGAGPEADRALARAVKRNRYVPAYLLGGRKPPKTLPAMYSPGSNEEAICYIDMGMRSWQRTPGALDWLAQQTQRQRKG